MSGIGTAAAAAITMLVCQTSSSAATTTAAAAAVAIEVMIVWGLIRVIVVVEGERKQLFQFVRGEQPLGRAKGVRVSTSSSTAAASATTTIPNAVASLPLLAAEHVRRKLGFENLPVVDFFFNRTCNDEDTNVR